MIEKKHSANHRMHVNKSERHKQSQFWRASISGCRQRYAAYQKARRCPKSFTMRLSRGMRWLRMPTMAMLN